MSELKIGAALPGEQLVVELLRFATAVRSSMSQENRDAYDKMVIAMIRGWHNFWITLGWPGEKI